MGPKCRLAVVLAWIVISLVASLLAAAAGAAIADQLSKVWPSDYDDLIAVVIVVAAVLLVTAVANRVAMRICGNEKAEEDMYPGERVPDLPLPIPAKPEPAWEAVDPAVLGFKSTYQEKKMAGGVLPRDWVVIEVDRNCDHEFFDTEPEAIAGAEKLAMDNEDSEYEFLVCHVAARVKVQTAAVVTRTRPQPPPGAIARTGE